MADFADKRDSQSLPAILVNTIVNLKAHDIKINEVLADTGYSSGGALKALEFHHIKGYIPNFRQYKPTREGFTFDPQNDRYICSQGAFVSYKKTYADAKGNIKKHYRASSLDCKTCPLRPTCIGKSFEKTIEDAIDKPYYDRMHERMQTDKAKIMRKLRQSTVEPVLGTLVNFLNMKRINARGINQANKHVLMAALAYNLKKYMNYSIKVRNVKAIEVIEAFKNAVISVLSDLTSNVFHFLEVAGIFFLIQNSSCKFFKLKLKTDKSGLLVYSFLVFESCATTTHVGGSLFIFHFDIFFKPSRHCFKVTITWFPFIHFFMYSTRFTLYHAMIAIL